MMGTNLQILSMKTWLSPSAAVKTSTDTIVCEEEAIYFNWHEEEMTYIMFLIHYIRLLDVLYSQSGCTDHNLEQQAK